MRELLADQYDATELRLQREALIREALDDAFIDGLGEKYGLYSKSMSPAAFAAGRENLRARFEVFGLNGTTFQVNAVANDRAQAQVWVKPR